MIFVGINERRRTMKNKKTVAVAVLLAVCALSAFGQLKKATPIPRKSSGGGGGYCDFVPRVEPSSSPSDAIKTTVLEDQTKDGDILKMQNGDLYSVSFRDQVAASILIPFTRFHVVPTRGGEVLLIVQSSDKVIHAKLLDPN